VQAPEHVVDNAKALAKAGDDARKRRKIVRKKPPEGSVSWSDRTFDRLVAAEPEPLTSSFAVSHAMLLNVANRPGDAFAVMRHLLTDNHEDRPAQRRHIRQAIAIYRALLAAGVVERLEVPDAHGRTVQLTGDLQLDFALNQALSPFALAAIELLDPDSVDYPLDVLSVLEATLDDPRQVLGAQLSKAKGDAVAAMKAEGIEYEERMRLLEDVSYPMPLAELLDAAFETYRSGHPWVADHRLSPKSVARDLAERAMTFTEYVGFYGLARSEGLVLRYLADAYQVSISPELISKITDAVLPELRAWQSRPLDAMYPLVYLDAIVVNDISRPGIGFDAEANEVTIITAEGRERPVARAGKEAVAEVILDELQGLWERRGKPAAEGGRPVAAH